MCDSQHTCTIIHLVAQVLSSHTVREQQAPPCLAIKGALSPIVHAPGGADEPRLTGVTLVLGKVRDCKTVQAHPKFECVAVTVLWLSGVATQNWLGLCCSTAVAPLLLLSAMPRFPTRPHISPL